MRYSIVLFIAIVLVGCGGSNIHINSDLSGPMRIEKMAEVQTSSLQVSIQPKTFPKEEPRVILIPIRMMNPIDNAIDVAKSITWELWNVWLQNEVFTQLDYASGQGVTSLQEALQYARQRKATILVTGISNSFLDGGSLGTSRVALNVQIYDVQTGSLLWSLHQSGELKPALTKDYIVVQQETILPHNPIGTIVATLAYNMVQPVKLWRNSRPHFTTES